ncbi:MAG: DUF1800 domain-containing protein [Chthoniobacterales bacterium]
MSSLAGITMLTALPAKDWNYEAAAHLLNRAAFGGTPEEIEQCHAEGAEASVDRLLNPPRQPVRVSDRAWSEPRDATEMRQQLRSVKGHPQEQTAKRKELRKEQQSELQDLRTWWLTRMLDSGAPLVEKMSLFWHGHFATSAQKVKTAFPMWQQNVLFREHALGHFPALLQAVSRDPAMMGYLDLQQSKKDRPNESWAREVMELFNLGIGNYAEQDVKESARAFTGYRINQRHESFRYAVHQHDPTPKTFIGHTGNFSGDDILRLIVAEPACPRFIGRKLWRFFVEDEPSPEAVKNVAELLRRHDFELKPALHEVFLSADFYSDRVRRTQIKGPVQFLVQSCKLLGTSLPPVQATDGALRSMGQMLSSRRQT